MNGKILAVWGSPGSGKSVVAAKMARRLAAGDSSATKGGNTILLFCDMLAPMLPCVCPPSLALRRRSLGAVFAAARITESLVRNNLTTLSCSDRLTLLGLQKGESARSYPPCQERQAVELMECLRGLADFTVVDCSSNLDALTLAALERADMVLRLVSGELKSLGYYVSNLPTLKERLPDLDARIRVSNAPRPLRARERAGSALSKTDFRLPYCAELERQYSDGNLTAELKSKDGRAFTRELDRIITTLETENEK
jgi:Flp pilus assembly CpaE family ATPase